MTWSCLQYQKYEVFKFMQLGIPELLFIQCCKCTEGFIIDWVVPKKKKRQLLQFSSTGSWLCNGDLCAPGLLGVVLAITHFFLSLFYFIFFHRHLSLYPLPPPLTTWLPALITLLSLSMSSFSFFPFCGLIHSPQHTACSLSMILSLLCLLVQLVH